MSRSELDCPLSEILLHGCDPQSNSPLFRTLPAEIRNQIFPLVLLRSYDKLRPYPSDSYYFRPGYEYATTIDTALLFTCKRVYLEAHLHPVLSNEHVFWGGSPGEKEPRYAPHLHNYFRKMSKEARENVGRVHLFTEMWWLEMAFPETCWRLTGVGVKELMITVRHTDWMGWEHGRPSVVMGRRWTRELKELKQLETLVIELETMEKDKEQVCRDDA